MITPEYAANFYATGTLGPSIVSGLESNNTAQVIREFQPDSELGKKIGENIRVVYGSLQTVTVGVDGNDYTFEIGSLEGEDPSQGVELRTATYSSSLSTNGGNVFELARDAALDPERPRLYVGAIGVGGASSISHGEIKFLRRYGSFMDVSPTETKELPVVRALGKAIREIIGEGQVVTALRSNSAGALLGTAYGAMFGGGNILSSHQNVRPGINDVGPFALAYGMLYTARRDYMAHEAATPDVLAYNPDMGKFVDAHRPDGFVPPERGSSARAAAEMMIANLVGLGRGPLAGDPLVADNIALRRTNPDAKVLLTVGGIDPLANMAGLSSRMTEIVRHISSKGGAFVGGLILPDMPHSVATHYPQFMRAIAHEYLEDYPA